MPSLNLRKSTPTPKFLGMAEAYFVCHIGPSFEISLIYAFIGCPQSVGVMIAYYASHVLNLNTLYCIRLSQFDKISNKLRQKAERKYIKDLILSKTNYFRLLKKQFE